MKILFLATAIAALLFGLGFILLPQTVLKLYGASLNEQGITITRLYGSAGIAFAVLAWFAMKSSSKEFIKGAGTTLFTYWLLGTIFLLIAQLKGQLDMVFGWMTVCLHGGMLLCYGYFNFIRKRGPKHP